MKLRTDSKMNVQNAPGERRFAATFVVGAAAFIIGLGIGMRVIAAPNENGGGTASTTSTVSSFAGRVLGIGSPPPSGTAADVDFSLFWKVWKDIQTNYYQPPVEDKKLLYGAIQGMADAVGDPYTTYFPPTEAKEFNDAMNGEFSGIGAEIGMKNNSLQIISPLPGSPAEKAGIKARDLILKINGEESVTMPVTEAVAKIRGPKGTDVTLTIGHPSDPPKKDAQGNDILDIRDVKITRDTIVVKSAKLIDKGNGIFDIEIRSFNADAAETFNALVDEAIGKGAKSFVIDVRNDPGGYLDRAIEISGEWLNGDVVVLQRKQGEITERYTGTGSGKLRGIPTVVLVNEGSASAAEILAGALQDYGAAKIVGVKTFGKGSVQNLIDYGDGSAMKITISEWLTPKGRSIDKEGIVPDVEVKISTEDENAGKDPQLDKALEILSADRSSR
jgi:carboxyl-terminal processing protease